jgi:hypothetical protein
VQPAVFFFNDALCLCKSCMYISIVTCLSQYMLLLGSLCRRIHQQTLPILTYYCEYVFIRRSMHDIFKYPHFGYFVGEVLVHITYEGRMGIYVCIMHSTITHIVIDSERAYSRFTVQAHIFKLGMCYPNLYIYIFPNLYMFETCSTSLSDKHYPIVICWNGRLAELASLDLL